MTTDLGDAGAAPDARQSLWHHRDFVKLWSAATVSLLGSQVTAFGMPIIAALVLKSSVFEVAMLGAVDMLPFILFTLPAGAWLDRVRRRPVMIAGDLGRGVALLTIPIAYAAGVLTIWQLYAVGFVAGTLTVLFDVADQSYLPALLDREDLVEGNAKLQVSTSAAQIVGQGMAGWLITLLQAPFAIVADAVSFFVSGGLISLVRKPEVAPERPMGPDGSPQNLRRDVAEGLRYVLGHPYLRMIAGCTGTSNFFGNISFAVLPVFLYVQLELNPGLVGTILAVGAFGFLLGAATSGLIARRLGIGPTIVWSIILSGPPNLMLAFMPRDVPVALAILLVSFFIAGFSQVVYNVSQVSLRQAITPLSIQGRMNATMRFIVWGTIPLGAVVGGVLGSVLTVRTTIFIGGVGGCLAFLWVLFSPVRSLREIPHGPEERAGTPSPLTQLGVDADAVAPTSGLAVEEQATLDADRGARDRER